METLELREYRTLNAHRTYRMDQLVADSGFSRQTIRKLIEQRILPPAQGRGPAAYYTDEHYRRLRAIRREREQRRTAADWRERFTEVRA